METPSQKLNAEIESAAQRAFLIDSQISELHQELRELVGTLQARNRPHEAGLIIGAQYNLKDSFYRTLGGRLRDMQT